MMKVFPVIDPAATGENILRLRKARGLSVRDLQNWFGFEEPQAIYKWQKGKSLPTVDNLYALGTLFDVPMEEILVPMQLQITNNGQQVNTCCPLVFCDAYLLAVWRFFEHLSEVKGAPKTNNSLPSAYKWYGRERVVQ